MKPVTPSSQGPRARLVVLALALGTLALYGPARHFGWVHYDDYEYVTGNPAVSSGLRWANVTWAFTQTHSANWHPLTWLSHMLDCTLWGLDPGPPHLVNAALHTLNAVLLFGLLRSLTGALWRSAVVAALFAWHPLHVESVAWIAERKDVLSTLLWLLTIWAYVGWVRRGRAWRYLAALGLFALGLMAKPMLVTLPCTLLLLDVWPLGRRPDRSCAQLLMEKLPFLLLAAGSAIITLAAQREGEAVSALARLPWLLRLENAAGATVSYLGATLWPAGLTAFYPYPASIPVWQTAGAAALLLGVSAWVWLRRRDQPWLAFGWCWFLGTLVPVSGLVQVGSQARADRYTYVPLIGIFVMLVWGAAAWARDRPGRIRGLALLTSALLPAYAVAAACQLGFWRDGETLFNRVLAVAGPNPVAYENLGHIQAAQQRWPEAIASLSQAAQLAPGLPETHRSLADALLAAGRSEAAAAEFAQVIRLRPDSAAAHYDLGRTLALAGRTAEAAASYEQALLLDPRLAPAHNNLGALQLQAGRPADAITHFEAALRLIPANARTAGNLGLALLQAGQTAEAVARLQQALALDPAAAGTHYNLGNALLQAGRPADAADQFRQALRLRPADPEARNNLGLALYQLNRLPEAETEFGAALRLRPEYPNAHYNLARLLDTQGRFTAAAAEYEAVLRLTPGDAEARRRLDEARRRAAAP